MAQNDKIDQIDQQIYTYTKILNIFFHINPYFTNKM